MPTSPLEPDRDAMVAMGDAAISFVADFVEGLPSAPAVNLDTHSEPAASLLHPPSVAPGDLDALLQRFRAAASQALETAGGGVMSFVPGGGLYTSALAEMLARVVNRFTAVHGYAPALVTMEESVLRWLCRIVGLDRDGGGDCRGAPGRAGGTITTGASLATLSAVVAARTTRLGEDFVDGTAYVTAHSHPCVAKAARIAGLPAARLRVVPTTSDLRMDPTEAERMIRADRAAGLRPFLLVGTAGTTDTGTVDPLPALGELTQRLGLWFHVDAAYGGFFQLTERGRQRLQGMGQADSLALDPHKGLFLPFGTGVLLVRDTAHLQAAFGAEGAAIRQDVQRAGILPNYTDLGPELTREFRGLRLWLPLHLHGVDAFRDALDEKLDLARYAYRELASDDRLEVPWEPDLSTVVFRLRARDGENGDEANQQLLERINASKRIHLSSTRIDGRHIVRICILSHRTHRDHVAEAVDIIRRAATETLDAHR